MGGASRGGTEGAAPAAEEEARRRVGETGGPPQAPHPPGAAEAERAERG